jgi:pyridoxamine 5'-phosphate oxidase-like protein
MAELRSVAQRQADVRATLEQNGHAWLATAAGSVPYVIVVQAVWDGESILVTTRESSRTARNLEQSRVARLALGDADDAIVIDATLLQARPAAEATPQRTAFKGAAGWDPGEQGHDWRLFVLRPTRIQAFRGYAEIEGRDVMKDGTWLV